MQCRTITIEELKKDNKRLCLSSLRVFGRCDECKVMQDFYKGFKKVPCESAVINEERLKNLKDIQKTNIEITELNKKLEILKGGLKNG